MDYCSPAQVKSLCAEFGFQFTKSLGQNFLISPEIVERIADSAGLDAETAVLEIGPGFGALTNALRMQPSRSRCKSALLHHDQIDSPSAARPAV